MHSAQATRRSRTIGRGFGETRAEKEDFSAVADLLAVIDAVGNGAPTILVGCSQGGRIALDTALLHPSYVRALVLIAPAVSGAPEPIYPPEIEGLMAQLKDAEQAGDLDRVNAIKAHLWLDGPLQPEERVTGEARRLFLDMNAIALRSPPAGSNLDVVPTFHRLREISAPSLVIWGDLDFPHIQERSRHIATMMLKGSGHMLTGTAHLPSLERPTGPRCGVHRLRLRPIERSRMSIATSGAPWLVLVPHFAALLRVLSAVATSAAPPIRSRCSP